MRPWAKWCAKHRMGWVVFAVLIVGLPVYLLIGCYQGAVELAKSGRATGAVFNELQNN